MHANGDKLDFPPISVVIILTGYDKSADATTKNKYLRLRLTLDHLSQGNHQNMLTHV